MANAFDRRYAPDDNDNDLGYLLRTLVAGAFGFAIAFILQTIGSEFYSGTGITSIVINNAAAIYITGFLALMFIIWAD